MKPQKPKAKLWKKDPQTYHRRYHKWWVRQNPECGNAYKKDWRKANPERANEYQRARRQEKQGDDSLMRKYREKYYG